MPVREYPNVGFHEDNDMHLFCTHAVAIERTTKYDHDVEERDEEAEGHDDAQYTDVEFGQVHVNSMGVKRIKGDSRSLKIYARCLPLRTTLFLKISS